MGDAGEKVLDNDAEGVWSPDIEQSFQEALAIYPPCGRRKIILSDEGKMYGRNELIARYIKLRTGKIRTRKQVSSHIQVLARRKTREIQTKFKQPTDLFHFWAGDVNQGQTTPDIEANLQAPYSITPIAASTAAPGYPTTPGMDSCLPSTTTSWPRSHIGTETLRLVEFTAFMEWQNELAMFKEQHRFVHIDPTPMCEPPLEMVDIRQIYDKFPEEGGGLRDLYDQGPPHAFFLVKFWADLSFSLLGEEPGGSGGAFYGVSSRYEGPRALTLNCTSKVCSFGKQVVEKLETAEPAHWEDGRYVFRMQRSALCEYLINFIRKLRTLPEKQMMDSVLENFTILQILRDQETQELLLCVAFVFEVSASELGAQHHIYRLGRD
ncbi:PREDICTED: transcriptional enhancer factor TEF-4 isoform X4 [Thamnophis sirtalis]|uniref:Transcriptional enhancer factor TEF-4 isoform X4 n=1 Tax=Thamnophis sirtalis TaxID=35019 RepID=A0A6I9X0L2_9SAUR|nr:PREDICTED: transcriptional enhancer factor TEF-4 isoform X4 [Thamnophis sirtalis]